MDLPALVTTLLTNSIGAASGRRRGRGTGAALLMRTCAANGLGEVAVCAENLKSGWESMSAQPFVNPASCAENRPSVAGAVTVHMVHLQELSHRLAAARAFRPAICRENLALNVLEVLAHLLKTRAASGPTDLGNAGAALPAPAGRRPQFAPTDRFAIARLAPPSAGKMLALTAPHAQASGTPSCFQPLVSRPLRRLARHAPLGADDGRMVAASRAGAGSDSLGFQFAPAGSPSWLRFLVHHETVLWHIVRCRWLQLQGHGG